VATLLRKANDFGHDQGASAMAGEKMIKMTRLIEGLQYLAEHLPLTSSITERDRVLLACLLNEGAAPSYAAEQVCQARNRLH
jgi:hypothetical protein